MSSVVQLVVGITYAGGRQCKLASKRLFTYLLLYCSAADDVCLKFLQEQVVLVCFDIFGIRP